MCALLSIVAPIELHVSPVRAARFFEAYIGMCISTSNAITDIVTSPQICFRIYSFTLWQHTCASMFHTMLFVIQHKCVSYCSCWLKDSCRHRLSRFRLQFIHLVDVVALLLKCLLLVVQCHAQSASHSQHYALFGT